ncbi:hypothetical protein GUJ93_ZPchr0008g13732 [Zizania palustris]|uniref:GST C-terminal domain-containing protein n=1 Tax=Zizania palustris TaxID=103762 RepID=A0A8J5UWU3_ZIZPA|nr:hypothetical protein GUJ93_ZPchr0008g13732 [Zizania palustris]
MMILALDTPHYSQQNLTYGSILSAISLVRGYSVQNFESLFYHVSHRYPADLFTRAKIEAILDWHHSNLRRGAATFVLNTVLAPYLGLPSSHEAAKQAEKLLLKSLTRIESIWLKGDAKFLMGNPQPSIADLSLVCEIMQLEILGDSARDRILGPYEKISSWIQNVKKATSPHFEEVHELLFKVKAHNSAVAAAKLGSELSKDLKTASKL